MTAPAGRSAAARSFAAALGSVHVAPPPATAAAPLPPCRAPQALAPASSRMHPPPPVPASTGAPPPHATLPPARRPCLTSPTVSLRGSLAPSFDDAALLHGP
eukprot:CAMPEP_0196786272 /NCGR_PEP_ID=MMETSP1104-20130614/21024_1 /TAXON_ID=33652 /ORGANISM="Cafeteria sp., Strain Caron Lab Isolate" /LENGTH=101 /DNA_ID=CAMNT_0042156587 /DNA_START=219 /DNA_END=524 /DNA_ORIENTATION=-